MHTHAQISVCTTCVYITHTSHTHTSHTLYGHTSISLLVWGDTPKCYSRTSQNYTSWKGNSRILFLADASLHNKTHGVWQWNLMFKLQNKIFVFTCLLYSLCNKSHSIFKDAFFIQLVAAHPTPHPTLLLVLQEAPLAIPVKKHLEKEGWTPSLISSWSHGDDGNFLGGEQKGAQRRQNMFAGLK